LIAKYFSGQILKRWGSNNKLEVCLAGVKKGNGFNESDSKIEILIRVEEKITELNDHKKYRLVQISY